MAVLVWFSLFLSALGVHQANITDALGPLLSDNAKIYLPGSSGFVNGTTRWSALDQPTIAAVVKVATEGDVQQTIKFANAHSIPFLVKGGGHGTNLHLAEPQDAIYIWTRGMSEITLAEDGTKAILQAGAESGEVIKTLWDLGKQTAATACDCVGFMAPILGGGHGWLQGRFGLVTDQLISARLVLGSGEIITVSETEHADLFWGIRGAGHNFGVVTSVEFRVYDRKPEEDKWAFEQYIFAHDKVEAVFEHANQMLPNGDGIPPVELTHYAHFERRPEFDTENPIILFWVIWQGTSIPTKYTSPLHALGPLNLTSGVIDTTGLNLLAGAAYDTPNCGNGANTILFPVSLEKYNTTALRTAFDMYAAYPSWLNNSIVLLEGYSTTAVHKIPSDSTAYPDRFNNLLLAPFMLSFPGASGSEEEMAAIGESVRKVLAEGSGQPLNAYVNYARGDESLEDVYGHEPWRLERLRALKAKYDPHGQFNYYNPIH
ncbi:FAD-binding domain-containing protein [Thozetella sp. PMI_491]|nr:FAD-binding domain-containing protein [Thozetella sp. PMI_491]